MANDAEKKAGKRKQRATLIYGAIAALANALFFGLNLFWFEQGIEGWTGLARVAALLATYAFSLLSLIENAAKGDSSDVALDLFALAVLIQVGSLYSSRFWWALVLIPAYAAWRSWAAIAPFVAQARESMQMEQLAQFARLAKKQDKAERQEKRGGAGGKVVYRK